MSVSSQAEIVADALGALLALPQTMLIKRVVLEGNVDTAMLVNVLSRSDAHSE
jgi:hypothetical protein